MPWHQRGEGGQSDLWVSAGRAGVGGRSSQCHSAIRLSSTSSHPVTHARSSALPQPSLLTNMLNLDGVTQGRSMGTQILCTDCHNSDDNREFGGPGPNGPHGSKWTATSWSVNTSSARPPLPANLSPIFFLTQISASPARMRYAASATILNNLIVEHQLQPARPSHQRWIHLLCLPYRARHGSGQRHDFRRATGELRCQRHRRKRGHADFL